MTRLSADDLSNLLFDKLSDQDIQSSLPLVGPIQISQQENAIVHGRGLITTRTIQPGEMIFVIQPTVYAPIETVYQRWSTKGARGCRATLEEVAEEVLLEQTKQCLQDNSNGEKQLQKRISFMMQLGEENEDEVKLQRQEKDMEYILDALLGRTSAANSFNNESCTGNISDANILSIIRRNAFGPDYHNYTAMEQTWNKQVRTQSGTDPYRRVLGLYPLAAIINHSCSANAVRVFAGELMMVHACTMIPRGEEIVWSYIPSSQPYHVRKNVIHSKFGFECCCDRCKKEEGAYDQVGNLRDRLVSLDTVNQSNLAGIIQSQYTLQEMTRMKEKLERDVLADGSLLNEVRRYLRVGYLNFYINYFNVALSSIGLDQEDGPVDATVTRQGVLELATQLHFALASCNNACTEHLSILHLSYELISIIHSSSEDKNKTMVNVRFWTEQLKRAHMIRYGALGNDLEDIREVMKHTRGVLRNLDGLSNARWKFI